MHPARGLLHSLTRSLFAGSCFLCRGAADAAAPGGLLCGACDADLPRLNPPACACCALPCPGPLCARCSAHRPHYDETRTALTYGFPADVLVQSLKFRGELSLATLLACALKPGLAGAGTVDAIVPIPLSAARMRERGYNQALLIARALDRDEPIETGLLHRDRDTTPQAELPLRERGGNMKGAFRCLHPIPGMRVALVDDVMTTGATLDEAARALKAAGASLVCNWVPVRTLPPD